MEGAALVVRRFLRSGWQGYVVSIALVAAAAVLTLLLRDYLRSTPAVILIAATLASTWYAGLWAGLLASLLTTLFTAFFFIEPTGTLDIGHVQNTLGLLIFLSVLVVVSALTTSRRESQRQLSQRYAQLDTLHRLSLALSRAGTLEEVQAAALANIKATLEADRAAILLMDPAGVMRFTTWTGLSDGYRAQAEGHSPWPANAADPRPVTVPDVALAPDLAALRPTIEAEGIRALAFIPLVLAGRLLGKFMLYYDQPRALEPHELALAQTIAGQIAVAVQQRQAADAVRNEREHLRVTLGSIGDAVITTDPQGRITFMNGVAQALTEWNLPEALGRPVAEIFDIISEITGAPAASPVDKVLREGVVAGLANHTLLRTRGGRTVPIDDSGAPIRDADGALLGVVLVFRDITERKTSEHLLETRAGQQAALAALGQEALAEPDLARLLDLVVARCAATLAVEYAKVLELQPDGATLRVVSGVGWQPGIVGQALVENTSHSQAGYTLLSQTPVLVDDLRAETRFVGMPLLHDHCVVSGMTVLIAGPDQPFGVLGAHTAQHRSFTPDDANFLQGAANVIGAAVARHRAEAALRLARDQNAAILASIAEGVTVQDAQGRLVYANNVAAQVMGFPSAAALLATPLSELMQRFELLDEAGAPLSLTRLPGRQALAGQLPPALTVRFRVRATGEERWSAISARPIFAPDDPARAIYAVNIFRDITDLKHVEVHQRVLAQAGGLLANGLDYAEQLSSLTRLIVPHLGDWCCIHLVDREAPGGLRLAAAAHAQPAREASLREWNEKLLAEGGTAVGRVVATGNAELYTDLTTPAHEDPAGPWARFIADTGLRSLLLVPLTARGRTVGAMSLAWAESVRAYTAADLEVAEELARRVALTADNARLYAAEHTARQAAEDAAQRTARLQSVTAAFSEALTPNDVMHVTLTQGAAALGAAAGALMLLSPAGDRLEIQQTVGFPPTAVVASFPLEAPIPAAEAVRTHAPVIVESYEQFAQRYPSVAAQRGATGHAASVYVPLLVEGRALGCLSVSFTAARTFAPEDQEFLLAVARQCAQALERARLFTGERQARLDSERARAEAEASRQRLAFLADISSTLSATLDYDSLMQRIAYLLVPYLADYASVYILEDDQRITNVANAHVSLEKQRLLHTLHTRVQLTLHTPHSLIAQVMRTGQPLLDPDFDWRAQYATSPAAMREYLAALQPVSHIIVPLTARGRALGVMVLAVDDGSRRFTRTDLALSEEVARRAALAADNARLFQQAQRLNAELEQRVAARTAELRAANVSLEHEVLERETAQAQLQALADELRALTVRLESVREEERTRLSREVHDELGGALTGLKMDLTRLRRQAEAQNIEGVLAQAQSMLGLLDSTVKTVRRIATDLRPGVLDDFGLVAAIEWQLQEFEKRAAIECRFSTTVDDLPLPPEAATALFRVFQETLTNVARHAQATRVDVELTAEDGLVRLRVADNGRGIARPDVFGTSSLGLLGMRERVHLLAGRLEIQGGPGQGTAVLVSVPLPLTGAEGQSQDP